MKPRYSGDKSKRFWKMVRTILDVDEAEWKALYSLGVALQNLEDVVLRRLKAARKKARK